MRISITSFALPKSGNEQTGSDDAISPENCQHIELSEAIGFRLAIADGASGSICAGIWAKQLVSAFRADRLSEDEQTWPFNELATEWNDASRHMLSNLYGEALPWFIEEKLQQPAQAALLGFRASIDDPDLGSVKWNAVAIGDACLFQLDQHGELIQSWPISNSEQFGNDPALVPASADGGTRIQGFVHHNSGRAESGDVFLIMTDALAACALTDHRELANLNAILNGGTSDSFVDWVANKRLLHHLKNDDVTVARLLFE